MIYVLNIEITDNISELGEGGLLIDVVATVMERLNELSEIDFYSIRSIMEEAWELDDGDTSNDYLFYKALNIFNQNEFNEIYKLLGLGYYDLTVTYVNYSQHCLTFLVEIRNE